MMPCHDIPSLMMLIRHYAIFAMPPLLFACHADAMALADIYAISMPTLRCHADDDY